MVDEVRRTASPRSAYFDRTTEKRTTFLTTKQGMDLLQLRCNTGCEWIQTGHMPAIRDEERPHRFDPRDRKLAPEPHYLRSMRDTQASSDRLAELAFSGRAAASSSRRAAELGETRGEGFGSLVPGVNIHTRFGA